jgi:hypothetical protein
VLGFCDGRAKAVRSSVGLSEFLIVDKGVLPWKIETFNTNTTCPKDFTMVVEPPKGIV